MGRLTRLSKREMFIDHFCGGKEFIGDRFSIWLDFVNNMQELVDRKFEEYQEKIKDFDLQHSDKAEVDGIDYYFDDIENLENSRKQILPLAFIGAYNDFEKYFKDYYNELREKFKEEIENLTELHYKNDKYIESVKKKLKEGKVIDIDADDKLNRSWGKIEEFKELRDILAHNDNPIPIEKSKRLHKVRGIQHLEISTNNFVTTSLDVLKNACGLYDQFIEDLTVKIAAIKF